MIFMQAFCNTRGDFHMEKIDELVPFHQQLYQASTLRGPIIVHKQGIHLGYGDYYETK